MRSGRRRPLLSPPPIARRTDPSVKDLFIDSDVGNYNIGDAVNLPLTKHFVFANDVGSNKLINFNFNNSGAGIELEDHYDQAGVVVRELVADPSGNHLLGLTDCPTAPDPCTPNTVLNDSKIYLSEIRALSPPTFTYDDPDATADAQAMPMVVGHEIGHAINMDDYPWGGAGTRLTVMVGNVAGWPNGTWTNFTHSYDDMDADDIRIR